jgi:hypothetical protein
MIKTCFNFNFNLFFWREHMSARTVNTDDGARVDIRARGFWIGQQDAFFDVREFYPNASSYRSQNIASILVFITPLVLSTTGGMGREAETFYKCLADMISNKRQQKYSATIGWLRCRMSFASLRSSIMCIRGSRSSIHRHIFGDSNISLATSEARIPRPRE